MRTTCALTTPLGALALLAASGTPSRGTENESVIAFNDNLEPEGALANGVPRDEPLVLEVGTDYRFRLMHITMGGPGLEVWLVEDGGPIRWTPIGPGRV